MSSSYAKILGETNFHAREIPRSGSKAEDGERKKESKHGARKSPGPKEREKERKTERWL